LLAGQSGTFTLVGDESLTLRPMERIAAPLRQMGLARTARGNAVAAARVGAVVARRRVKRSERLRRLYYDGLAPLRRRILASRADPNSSR
ncbi:MAG TPA: hypothetical protein VM204_05405, partial [Gaiellaceae bacterium]|nr:hypothetical protein [Gaiellaceae bacterium]